VEAAAQPHAERTFDREYGGCDLPSGYVQAEVLVQHLVRSSANRATDG
jgi:hypothetical protein